VLSGALFFFYSVERALSDNADARVGREKFHRQRNVHVKKSGG
jgi:hypothetical protein